MPFPAVIGVTPDNAMIGGTFCILTGAGCRLENVCDAAYFFSIRTPQRLRWSAIK
jgi:hypothetical protein